MKSITNSFKSLGLAGSIFLTSASSVLAGGYNNPLPKDTTLFTIAANAVPWGIALVGLGIVFYGIYGGFLWLTSAGDPRKLEEAQATIRNAILGFLSIFGFAIVLLILAFVLGVNIAELFGGGATG